LSIFGWVSDCCLTPIQQFLAASWREQVIFQWDDDEVCFVINQHALNNKFWKTGCLGIRIMCLSGATCLPADCCFCFSKLAL
jgi:hypothetical protein